MKITDRARTVKPTYWMVSIVGLLVLIALVTQRSPQDVGPQGILLFFFLVLVILTSVIAEMIKRLNERSNYRGKKFYLQRAIAVSFPLTLLFALSTQGSLNIVKVISVAIFSVAFSMVLKSNINNNS